MALIGIQLDRKNPAFTIDDFVFWMPQFTKYVNYYCGMISMNGVPREASIYLNDMFKLYLYGRIVNLTTLDEETYTGSLIIQETHDGTLTNYNYDITLVKSTMLLTLVLTYQSGEQVTSQCKLVSEGNNMYNQLYTLANNKIFKSIYGSDWSFAMSLCIAHYMTLIANQVQAPAGNTLQGIAGGQTHGVLSSASVGSFSKSYDLSKTMVDENEALFWNQTSFGAELMALLKTKAVPSILVVTSNPIIGAN